MDELTPLEAERYQRQIMFWGEDNQLTLKKKTVLVVGAGGLGSPVLYYLAAAGIGRIKICDFDTLQLSNLNRQILHGVNRVGINKAISAKISLSNLNEQIQILPIQEELDQDNFLEYVEGCDLFLDVCDSVRTKELLNQCIVENDISAIMSAIVGCGGYAFFNTPGSFCWSCLFKNTVESGRRKRRTPFLHFPSFGASCGMLGAAIANMAVRYLLGNAGQFLNRIIYMPQLWDFHKLMVVDRAFSSVMTEHFTSRIAEQDPKFPLGDTLMEQNVVSRDPNCPVCKRRSTF